MPCNCAREVQRLRQGFTLVIEEIRLMRRLIMRATINPLPQLPTLPVNIVPPPVAPLVPTPVLDTSSGDTTDPSPQNSIIVEISDDEE